MAARDRVADARPAAVAGARRWQIARAGGQRARRVAHAYQRQRRALSMRRLRATQRRLVLALPQVPLVGQPATRRFQVGGTVGGGSAIRIIAARARKQAANPVISNRHDGGLLRRACLVSWPAADVAATS